MSGLIGRNRLRRPTLSGARHSAGKGQELEGIRQQGEVPTLATGLLARHGSSSRSRLLSGDRATSLVNLPGGVEGLGRLDLLVGPAHRRAPLLAGVSSITVPARLRVAGAQTKDMPIYLRVFFRVLSSWGHGIYQRKRQSRGGPMRALLPSVCRQRTRRRSCSTSGPTGARRCGLLGARGGTRVSTRKECR